jgi:hypothetical protein
MDAFAAAKRAAAAKGFKGTKVDDGTPPAWRRPGNIALVVLLLLIGLGITYYKTRPAPPPAYTKFPTDKVKAVEEAMDQIATGTDEAYLKVYSRLDPAAYDKSRDDEKGEYRQLFHVMNQYLAGEFGDDWNTIAKYEPDPAEPERVAVKVGLETLHARVGMVTPKEEIAKGAREHWALRAIEEFPVDQASGFQSKAAQMAIIEGVAGKGAVANLNTILGATGQNRHETLMQKKVRMLPILRNPRETVYRTILQTYPMRDDPVVRARLEAIQDDARYEAQAREAASGVLKNNLPEGVLEGAGVE